MYEDITFREDAQLAVMVRKNNPLLLEELNDFIKTKHVGNAFAKVATEKYFKSKRYKKLSKSGISKKKFQSLRKTFHKRTEVCSFFQAATPDRTV